MLIVTIPVCVLCWGRVGRESRAGQFICGARGCDNKDGLHSYEVRARRGADRMPQPTLVELLTKSIGRQDCSILLFMSVFVSSVAFVAFRMLLLRA